MIISEDEVEVVIEEVDEEGSNIDDKLSITSNHPYYPISTLACSLVSSSL